MTFWQTFRISIPILNVQAASFWCSFIVYIYIHSVEDGCKNICHYMYTRLFIYTHIHTVGYQRNVFGGLYYYTKRYRVVRYRR